MTHRKLLTSKLKSAATAHPPREPISWSDASDVHCSRYRNYSHDLTPDRFTRSQSGEVAPIAVRLGGKKKT